MIKMIFCDMDGTLLDGKGRLPAEFDEVAAELIRRGVIFAPASGRQYYSLLETFPDYAGYFLFVAENGTAVWYQGARIDSSPMPESLVREVLETGLAIPTARSVFCGFDYGYLLKAQEAEGFLEDLHIYYSRTKSVDSFADVKDTAVKLSFFDVDGRAEERIYPVMEKYQDRLQVVLASANWVDIMNPDISKGAAVRRLQKSFGVTADECACFGDYMNDAEMMDAVTHSYAMANAYPDIKKRARHIAPANTENGVMVTIKKLIDEGKI